MQVEVVSPEQVLYQDEAQMVVCSTVEGDIAFLPQHEPFLGLLRVAKVRVINGDEEKVIAVHRGFVETDGNHVRVLSDDADLPEQIDRSRAEEAKQRALAVLAESPDDPDAHEALLRAELRLEVAFPG